MCVRCMKSRLLFFLRSFILLLMLCLSISCSKEEIINVRVSPDDKIYGKTICIIGDSISSFAGSAPSDLTGYDGEKYLYFYPLLMILPICGGIRWLK